MPELKVACVNQLTWRSVFRSHLNKFPQSCLLYSQSNNGETEFPSQSPKRTPNPPTPPMLAIAVAVPQLRPAGAGLRACRRLGRFRDAEADGRAQLAGQGLALRHHDPKPSFQPEGERRKGVRGGGL
nr:hypothetical protein Iba_chr14fCG0470 [Ipomoea batatas]GME09264.1 hypothetical protein Iba_scaffold8486CG0120 [Ipomoea batatas]